MNLTAAGPAPVPYRRFLGIERLLATVTVADLPAIEARLGPDGPAAEAVSAVLARHGHRISRATINDYRRHLRQLGAPTS